MLANKIPNLFNNKEHLMTRAGTSTQQPHPHAREAPRRRHQVVLETAARAGLLRGDNGRIAGWVRAELIRSAKERSGLTSDTQLLE